MALWVMPTTSYKVYLQPALVSEMFVVRPLQNCKQISLNLTLYRQLLELY